MPVASSVSCIVISFRIRDQESAVIRILVVKKYQEFAIRDRFCPREAFIARLPDR